LQLNLTIRITCACFLPGGKADYKWGTFSISIPGRVGYICSNYYRELVKSGDIVDDKYMAGAYTRPLFIST
jgi:hypothetical protein